MGAGTEHLAGRPRWGTQGGWARGHQPYEARWHQPYLAREDQPYLAREDQPYLAREDQPYLATPPERAVGPALPRLALVRQRFSSSHITDIQVEIAAGFALHAGDVLRPGMRVAITAGSRGIDNIAQITRAVVEEVRARGAEPFVVAAMGSHGGATASGQREVLAGYGITEERVGCPIVSSMETICLGETEEGFAVHLDRAAYQADAIVLVNRVKPHSILTGNQGSGLLKMAAIGLGKQAGADSIHRKGVARNLLPAARLVLARSPIALGVAIVENSLDRICKIETVPRAAIEEADTRLLKEARKLLPTIPFDPIDILIVNTIGKNFSGAGMDPNVIGMHRRIGGPPQREIGRIVALDLSDQSHGNAIGMGMADIVTEQLRNKIDWHATYMNATTSDFLAGAKLPIVVPTGREAVQLAMKSFDVEDARILRVSDTAHLGEMWVSEALLAELDCHPQVEQLQEPGDMRFDESEFGG